MDRAAWLKTVGVVTTAIGMATTARFALSAPVELPPNASGPRGPAPEREVGAQVRPDSLAQVIAARNPFRMGRAPSAVPYDPSAADAGVPPPPPRPPRPNLVLAGLILGADPAALVDGLPGVEGTRVMHPGERVGDYVLRSVSADRAVIAGPDTVWTLRVRSQFP